MDDAFINWNETIDTHLEFKSVINNIRPNIEFTIAFR